MSEPWTPRNLHGMQLWWHADNPNNVRDRDGAIVLMVNDAGKPSLRDRWYRLYWRVRCFFGYRAGRSVRGESGW